MSAGLSYFCNTVGRVYVCVLSLLADFLLKGHRLSRLPAPRQEAVATPHPSPHRPGILELRSEAMATGGTTTGATA